MAARVRVLLSHTTNPWFNLATEDWIFRELDPATAVLFLWRNEPSVVIGKHQNPWIECDVQLMERDGIALARRQSGGGAVFHDLGNTNFTFLTGSDSYNVDDNFDIVLAALAGLGIDAERNERNDIVLDGRKFSGNAFKHTRDRSFHHGTLLIDADLDRLTRYLNPRTKRVTSKGIKSVRSVVANLSEVVPHLDHGGVCAAVADAFCAFYGERVEPEILDESSLRSIPILKEGYEKVAAWEWRFGLTPDFAHTLAGSFPWGEVEVTLDVHRGTVAGATVETPFAELSDLMHDTLVGVRYGAAGIGEWCRQIGESLTERLPEIDALESWFKESL